jgi:hypothetical protein
MSGHQCVLESTLEHHWLGGMSVGLGTCQMAASCSLFCRGSHMNFLQCMICVVSVVPYILCALSPIDGFGGSSSTRDMSVTAH